MKTFIVLLSLLLLATPVATLSTAPANAPAEAPAATPITAPTTAPTTAPADALANARMDFNSKCSNCHRATGRILRAAKQLNVEPQKLTLMTTQMSRDEIIAITETGKNKMPAFEKELSRERIEAIADYILLHHKRKNRGNK